MNFSFLSLIIISIPINSFVLFPASKQIKSIRSLLKRERKKSLCTYIERIIIREANPSIGDVLSETLTLEISDKCLNSFLRVAFERFEEAEVPRYLLPSRG